MLNILIIGENSYIGNNFISIFGNKYNIIVRDSFKKLNSSDFKNIDVVWQIAAIVHQKEKKDKEKLYYDVNTKLAVDSFIFAKENNVKQFIFMSTMALYGDEPKIGTIDKIYKNTKPNPRTFYGKSKLLAEEKINKLLDNKIKLFTIRPPMVYGDGCKGNYPKLLKIAEKVPFIPTLNNYRSTISIHNLCAFIDKGIEKEFSGVYFPQDVEYANTKEIISRHKEYLGKKKRFCGTLNIFIKFGSLFLPSLKKAFGSKIYDFGEVDQKINVKY